MWAIEMTDKINKRKMYIREEFDDGKILIFEQEEDALRLMQEIYRTINSDYLVSFMVSRFTGDPRKEKLKKYDVKYLQRTLSNILESFL